MITLITLAGVALVSAQDPVEQMRSSLEEGAYALAAQITGPNLVRDFPDNPEAHFLYAYALYLTDNLSGSRQELNKALALSPEPADPQYDHLNGLLRAAEGDTDTALRLLKNAFVRSQDYEIGMDWGRVAWSAGRFDVALEAYKAASTTVQGARELWPYLNSGRILASQGEFEAAAAAFNQAITTYDANDTGEGLVSPGQVQAYFLLAQAQEQMNDLNNARANYEAAIQLDPNYSPAQAALADLVRRLP